MRRPADERSNEDLITDVLCDRIRELECELEHERQQKHEALQRYAEAKQQLAEQEHVVAVVNVFREMGPGY